MSASTLVRITLPLLGVLLLAIGMGVPTLRGAVKLHRRLTRRSSRGRRVQEPGVLRALVIVIPIAIIHFAAFLWAAATIVLQSNRATRFTNLVPVVLVCIPVCFLWTSYILSKMLPATWPMAMGVTLCLALVALIVAGTLWIAIPLVGSALQLIVGS